MKLSEINSLKRIVENGINGQSVKCRYGWCEDCFYLNSKNHCVGSPISYDIKKRYNYLINLKEILKNE